jgi:predicted ester cyclase
MIMSVEENKALVRRYYNEVLNGSNLAMLDQLCAPDFTARSSSYPPVGLGQFKQALSMARRAFPDLRVTIEDQLAVDDKVVTRWRAGGANGGELAAVAAPDGKAVSLTAIHIHRVAGNRIVELWEEVNLLNMAQPYGNGSGSRSGENASARYGENHIYDQDGLRSIHNHEFMDDPRFQRAYQRGVAAAGEDYSWHWRVHVGLWVASCSSKLEGDFVECGVNRGCLSSAIMDYLDWDRTGKTFYLLDTFSGLDEHYISDQEKQDGMMKENKELLASGFYVSGVETVKANFAEWKNLRIIQGPVPQTLDRVDAKKVAYLHLDMNCSPPEVAAAEYFWPRLVPGAIVLLDDYAYRGYRSQKIAMDGFARSVGLSVLSLPTGQGMIIKPARETF